MRRDVPRLVQQAREITRETLHELASDSPEDQQRLKRLLKETDQILVRVEESLIEELSLPLFDEKMITTVYSMHWTLFTSHNKLSFLTGDNPFCYTESEGLLILPYSYSLFLATSSCWGLAHHQDTRTL